MTDYNVAKLAKDLDTEAHLVRAKLRNLEIEKTEGKYEWATQKAYDAVLKQLKAGTKTEAVKDDVKVKAKKGAPEDKDAGKTKTSKKGKKAKAED